VGFSGAKVADLLGEDSLRHNGKVLDAVNRWVKEKLGGWQLGIAPQGDFFSEAIREFGLDVNWCPRGDSPRFP
jgi:hypothetical protein